MTRYCPNCEAAARELADAKAETVDARKRYRAAREQMDALHALCERQADILSRFVCAPDVVASARRTLECFEAWREKLNDWPIALVAQDGQEDLPIPWERIDAIFIGGSTRFKESQAAVDIIKTGQILSKWTHVGRVNDPHRFDKFLELGVDSIDGTGLARYTWMRERIAAGFPLLEQAG